MAGTRSETPARSQGIDMVDEEATEQTPLLSQNDGTADEAGPPSPASDSLRRSLEEPDYNSKSRLRRWPSLLALLVLCIAIIAILVGAFLAPQIMSQYAQEAVVFEPTSLSIDSFTSTGAVAHVKGQFTMDAARVKSKSVRDLGRFGAYVARMVATEPTTVEVSFPEYGSPVVGTAEIPAIKVNIQNGHRTAIDFLTPLEPGSVDSIRRVAEDWVNGKLGQLRVEGKADVRIRSGLLRISAGTLRHEVLFEGQDVPSIPDFDFLKLNVHEQDLPGGGQGLVADVALSIANAYPVDVTVPPMGFKILVPACAPGDPYIVMADAWTESLHVKPKEDIALNVTGLIRRLPKEAVTACPGSFESPLDVFLGNYLHGQASTVYVRGSDSPSEETPEWLSTLISDITVPVPFHGKAFGHLIKDFSMKDVHFDLPDFFAEPDSPESKPRVSAKLTALVALPDEINFRVSADRVRAQAFVYYKKKKFGDLDLHEWLAAQSHAVPNGKNHSDLEVQSEIVKAPLTITDADVFGNVVSALLYGGKGVNLTVKAKVDVEMETALGKMVVREIPASGDVPVSGVGGHSIGALAIRVSDIQIIETSPAGLTVEAAVDFDNPTNYTASVPYFDLHVAVNDTLVGHASVRGVSVGQGNNTKVPVRLAWDPLAMGGSDGAEIGRELISQYISGYNTSFTFKMHKGSIPGQRLLNQALERFNVTLPLPHIGDGRRPGEGDGGDDDEEKGPRFIQHATMHLLSSTAEFDLLSPLQKTSIYITHINATAKYKGDVVGTIEYEGSLLVPPGPSTTPRLPVGWRLGSVGYEAVRKALGGTLRLAARADVGVRIGEFHERLWFEGKSIGAKVRL